MSRSLFSTKIESIQRHQSKKQNERFGKLQVKHFWNKALRADRSSKRWTDETVSSRMAFCVILVAKVLQAIKSLWEIFEPLNDSRCGMEGGKVRYRWGKRWEGIELRLWWKRWAREVLCMKMVGFGQSMGHFRPSLELVREKEQQG